MDLNSQSCSLADDSTNSHERATYLLTLVAQVGVSSNVYLQNTPEEKTNNFASVVTFILEAVKIDGINDQA